MGEEQGLSAENRRLIEGVIGAPHLYMDYSASELNTLLNAARSEGLQPPVGGCEGKDLGSVGSGLTPLVPSPSASGLIAQPSDWAPLNAEHYGAVSDVMVKGFGYPFRIVVKPTSWQSAMDASPIYIGWGKNEESWAFTGKASVEGLITALQHALLLAREPDEDGSQSPVTSDGEVSKAAQQTTEPKPISPTDCQTSGGEA